MKKKIISIPSLDDAPEGAEFLILVPDELLQPSEPSPTLPEFVVVEEGEFRLGGERLKFAGTNAYYLPTYESHDPSFCDRTWNLFTEAGVNLVRTWGFYDGPPRWDGDPSFQKFVNGKAFYNETGLQCLDRTIAKATERGIHLIIALTNYHEQLGGYKEYCKAVGVPEVFSSFINTVDTQVLYKAYIHMLLNRVNTVTGRAYKDEPFIMAWEVCNEARNSTKKPEILRDWYQEIARFIKSIDPNHLVATGEDGFEDIVTGSYGTDGKVRNEHYTVDEYSNTYVLRADEGTSYILNTAIPEIDFGTFHWYPIDYGFGNANTPELQLAQIAWLSDHYEIAREFNKPVILEEYGFHIDWMPNNEVYSLLWKVSEEVLDGDLLWQFVTDGPKRNESGGNISLGRGDYNAFLQHLTKMKTL